MSDEFACLTSHMHRDSILVDSPRQISLMVIIYRIMYILILLIINYFINFNIFRSLFTLLFYPYCCPSMSMVYLLRRLIIIAVKTDFI